jgi:hypothetical protein
MIGAFGQESSTLWLPIMKNLVGLKKPGYCPHRVDKIAKGSDRRLLRHVAIRIPRIRVQSTSR